MEPAASAPSGSESEPEPSPVAFVPWTPQGISRCIALGCPAVAAGGELRCYAVWSLCKRSGDRQWAGVHLGRSRTAYEGLLLLNGGSFGGLAWRREANVEAAERRWLSEAERHKLDPKHIRFFFWQPKPPSLWDQPLS